MFLGFVEYLDWNGGVAGAKADGFLHLLVGRVAVLAPVLLVAVGAAIFLRSRLLEVRPLRTGVALAVLGSVLAFSTTSTLTAERHGGLIGSYLRTLLEGFIGSIGVSILVVLLLVAAVVLITGGSIGLAMRSSGRAVAQAAGAGARFSEDMVRLVRERPASRPRLEAVRTPAQPREAPLDGSQEFADIFADLPQPEQPSADEPAEPEPDPETPGSDPGVSPDDPSTGDVTEAPRLAMPSPRTPYRLPPASILKRTRAVAASTQDHERVARQLLEALASFGVEARLIGMVSGPRVTRYELQLAAGTKVNRVSQLRDDLAYALATTEIRILAPIPGKQAVGVEVPNSSSNLVTLGDIYGDAPAGSSPLTAWLGKDIAGNPVACDLAKMPHLLIAGTTGSGKSGSINAILSSILLRAAPDEVRMILVDPKRVELNHYESIPHLLTPVVTNMKNASLVLQNVAREMDSRYELMGAAKARNLSEWNRGRTAKGDDPVPYILVVIDELADLMMVSPAEVEDTIIRLAQKSRAVGIHLVLATQSPRVDVITGMIKANVPSRIAFAVSSQTDSRVILDVNGAEALLGQGDMLYKPLGTSKLARVQGAYISEEETRLIVEACRRQGEPEFEEELLEAPVGGDAEGGSLDADEDPVLDDAIRLVAQHQTASVSLLQRRLRVGYTRAGRLIDMLERRGIVSGYEGSKARNVLVTERDLPRILGDRSEPPAAPEDDTQATF
ncbi:MAG TPA: DNA translocase FtsK 4TM domain-containing protein [Gaiellales bacterium]|nr:DNA translocase FtsK 4TM domain-containing protein [Gaiellales bacterium]